MFKVIIQSIRPQLEVEFWRYDPDLYDYIEETFVHTGRMLYYKVTKEEDDFTELCEMMFDSRQEFQEFMKDPVIAYQEPIRTRFNQFYKIASSINQQEIVVSKDLYNIYLR